MGRVRIVASTVGYPPHRFIGSELMTHAMLKALQALGHDVVVHARETKRARTYDGIRVVGGAVPDGDVLVFHADYGTVARDWSGRKVAVCHNSRIGVELGLRNTRPDFAVVNSDAMHKAVPYGRKIVVHPPLTVPTRQSSGADVTVINLEESNKVGPFYELAELMPDVSFLGVRGGYGEQLVPDPLPSNVTVIDQVKPSQMWARVWSRTGVLLVPSESESWSMVASEAMSYGVPVIANPLPGLLENLGWAGLWARRTHVEEWVAGIRWALEKRAELSPHVRSRAEFLAGLHERDLDVWCRKVEAL